MNFSNLSFGDYAELTLGFAGLAFASWLLERAIQAYWRKKGTTPRKPKLETHNEKVDRIRPLIRDVLPALGDIMEQSPLTIFPAAKLPLPKDEMKIALQLAWGMTTDERLRGFVVAGYLHLANFRDDVDRPIDPTLTDGMTPPQTVTKLDPFLAISKSWVAETDELRKEFEEFQRLSIAMTRRDK